MIIEIKTVTNKDPDAHDSRSLTKSDSSTDSGVAEVNSNEFPTKSKRKISVIAREARSSPNVKDEIKESQLHVEFQIERKECPVSSSLLDKRKRSFESVTLQPKWHCPPKSVWKPTVEVRRACLFILSIA